MSPARRSVAAPARARLTYRAAGVDIDAGDEAVRRLAPWARSTYRPEVLGDIGAFAGFFRIPRGYRQPVLLASTDGVGSKLRVAFLANRHDTIGIDLVAMGVNDLLVHGAEPLVFLDYVGTNRVVPRTVEAVVRGIAAGCREAGCALIGGEIAELPDFYAAGEYDLAGFALGVVERRRLIDGRGVRPGDVVIGLLSNGLHSNGYSLARKVVFERLRLTVRDRIPGLNRTSGRSCSVPTRIYVKPVLALLRAGARDPGDGARHRRRAHRQPPARPASGLPRRDPARHLARPRGVPVAPAPRPDRRGGDVPGLQHGHRLRPRGAGGGRGGRPREALEGARPGLPDRGDPSGVARRDLPIERGLAG